MVDEHLGQVLTNWMFFRDCLYPLRPLCPCALFQRALYGAVIVIEHKLVQLNPPASYLQLTYPTAAPTLRLPHLSH